MYDLVDAFDEEDEEIQGGYNAAPVPVPSSPDDTKRAVEPPFADFMQSRGIRMRFELMGKEDGPPLLFIPGATSDLRKEMTMSHMRPLARTFHILTCDLRNQGETTPTTLDKYVPITTYVEDLIELLDHTFGCNTPVYVVGWSFGAVVALSMARLHADRVKRLVIVQGGYFKPKPNETASLSASSSPQGLGQASQDNLFGNDWAWVKDICAYDTLSVGERCKRMLRHADVRRKDQGHFKRMTPSFKWLQLAYFRSENVTVMQRAEELGKGVLSQLTAMFAEGTESVEEIQTPTLIVHARHDGMISLARAQELEEKMSSAQLLVVEDHGHVGVFQEAYKAVTHFCANSHLQVAGLDLLAPLVLSSPAKDAVEPYYTSYEADLQARATPKTVKLSKGDVIGLHKELIEEYSELDFQAELYRLFHECSDSRRLAVGRQGLCWGIQMDVIQKYGFAATSAGWLESLSAAAEYADDFQVAANQDLIHSLLNPPQTHPRTSVRTQHTSSLKVWQEERETPYKIGDYLMNTIAKAHHQ